MTFVFGRAWRHCLPISVLLMAGAAQAAPRHMEASGSKLAIDSSCAESVSIEPDPALTGRVTVDATADHPEEIAQLALDSFGDTAKLHQTVDHCARVGTLWSSEPTLHLTVRVPAGMAISLDEGGGDKYQIGAVDGPMALDLSGGVELHAANATTLSLDLSGGGQVALGQVNGAINGDISGGGTVKIDHVTGPSLALEVSGGGGFTIGDGKIDRVKIDLSGGGEAHIGATVGDATADVSGGGSVDFARVTGQLHKDVSGSGEVNVAGQ